MSLRVLVDGVPLPEDEGRAFWARFSAHMDEHKGDLAGFAAREGYASVHPSLQGGEPILLASRSAPQRPYTAADRAARGGGSSDHHGSTRDPSGKRTRPAKRAKGKK